MSFLNLSGLSSSWGYSLHSKQQHFAFLQVGTSRDEGNGTIRSYGRMDWTAAAREAPAAATARGRHAITRKCQC